MGQLKSFAENPPDLLAVVGAYNEPARGCAAVGLLSGFLDKSATDFQYIVYFHEQSFGSLKERAQMLAKTLDFPVETPASNGDNGYIRNKASNGRIRSLFRPKEENGSASLVSNQSYVLFENVLKREFKEVRDRDLCGFDPAEALNLRDHIKFIPEWIDCLHSAVVSAPVKSKSGKSAFEKIVFLGGSRKKDNEALTKELAGIEVTPDGKIRNATPMTMALVLALGRTEWLAQTGQLEIQAIARGNANVL